jgi:hypothetical protein
MAAEVDDLAIRNVEQAIAARIATGPYAKSVMSWLERHLDRLVPFYRTNAPAIGDDLESTASQFNAGSFPCQPERGRHLASILCGTPMLGGVPTQFYLGIPET